MIKAESFSEPMEDFKEIETAAAGKKKYGIIIKNHFVPLMYVLVISGYGLMSYIPDLIGVDSRLATVPYWALVDFIALIIIVVSWHKKLHEAGGAAFRFFMFFWFIYLIRVIYSVTVTPPHLLGREDYIYLTFGIGVCFLPSLSLFTAPSSRALKWLPNILCLTLSIVCLMSIGNMQIYQIGGRLWANSVFNAISLGHVAVSLSIVSLFNLFFETNEKRWWHNILYVASLFLSIYVLLSAGSRGPLVAILFTIPLCLFATANRSRISHYIKMVLLILIVASTTPLFLEDVTHSGGSITQRVTYLDSTSVTDDIRFLLLEESMREFIKNPFIGSSLDIPGLGYPHNTVAEAFIATGLLGGIPFLAILTIGIVSAFRLFKSKSPNSWIGLLFIQYLIAGMFSGTLYTNYHFWCLYSATVITTKRH